MPNRSKIKGTKEAYGLSIYCPIENKSKGDRSYTSIVRNILQDFEVEENSPLARVPNTYLARFYIITDAIFEGFPYEHDHLKSDYLAFNSNFYGDRDEYLEGMYKAMKDEIHELWQYCYAFDQVNDAASFIKYIDKVQVKTTFFFVGSNDDPLKEQLKGLYLKQEFSKFVFANQNKSDEELLAAYKKFDERTKPTVLEGPTWKAGAGTLAKAYE